MQHTELVSEQTVKQFVLWGHWQNAQQLPNSAFNDHSNNSRKWSTASLVCSNEVIPFSFSAKGVNNENKIIPQSLSLFGKLIFTNL